MSSPAPPTPPHVSLVVPTLNEAGNLPALVRRVDAALSGTPWSYEVIVVDDGSTDGTPDAARRLAGEFPVRAIERGRVAEGGLSGAVLAGFAEARGEVLAVMDADLQHPPERLPALLAALENGAELAIGSRYTQGGQIAEKWGLARRTVSRVATLLGRPFARGVRDPMSGFFALPREVFERGRHLSPLGYKILLELLAKCRPAPVAEVPIQFAQRAAGQSKLTIKEQFRYLEHLSRLYDYQYSRKSPVVKFAIVVALAWLTGAAVLALSLPLGRVPAVGLAYAAAVATAGVFHARYVRTQRAFLIRPTPWRDFLASAAVEWLVATVAAGYLVLRADPPAWEVFAVAFSLATLARYVLRKELLLDVRGLRPDPVGRWR